MDENTLYAAIHDQMREEKYIVNYYDIARIIEIYHEILYKLHDLEETRNDG
jgi:hypothetical protein